jgi:YHS domain-containing protein
MVLGKKLILSSTFIASALIFTGLAAYSPGDSSHVVSVTTPEGGRAMHGAHFSYGINRCSVLVTSKVKLDRKEDLKISVEGKNPPPYQIFGKNPSVFDIGIHNWPVVEGDKIRGVEKDNIAFYVVFSPSEKDTICDMWVDDQESGDAKDYKGKNYQFCSTDCRNVFAKEPAKFADKPLATEKCNIVLTDTQGRKVLTVPVDFSDPRSKDSAHSSSARPDTAHCADGAAVAGSGKPDVRKSYRREGK